MSTGNLKSLLIDVILFRCCIYYATEKCNKSIKTVKFIIYQKNLEFQTAGVLIIIDH